ncbi:prepilin-type N-terminal cleavage/methylation domain-containing protein [Marinobacterium aestuariivivens]|uniref:Prepilin-type N-terminal cleavage/methylation domain-containing protein n=1 Tax=Marinobacterium aestuariivivens TaxID=1698799 RepID=A0ABW2A0K5_9GAMM
MSLKFQQGVSLIELMIAMVLGLLVSAIVIGMFSSTVGSTRQAVSAMRLNQELRTVMDMMVRDIRRSGYWAGDSVASNPHASVIQAGLPVNVFTSPKSADANSCVVLSYDYDADQSATIEHLMGYRLDDAEGAVEVLWASSSSLTSNVDCTVLNSTNWENLTDREAVDITGLVFTPLPSAASFASATVRSIQITLTGQSKSDSKLVRQLIEEVRVRNDL